MNIYEKIEWAETIFFWRSNNCGSCRYYLVDSLMKKEEKEFRWVESIIVTFGITLGVIILKVFFL